MLKAGFSKMPPPPRNKPYRFCVNKRARLWFSSSADWSWFGLRIHNATEQCISRSSLRAVKDHRFHPSPQTAQWTTNNKQQPSEPESEDLPDKRWRPIRPISEKIVNWISNFKRKIKRNPAKFEVPMISFTRRHIFHKLGAIPSAELAITPLL